MSFTSDDIRYFQCHGAEIDAVRSVLSLTKASYMEDRALTERFCGTHGRAVFELLLAREKGRAQGKIPPDRRESWIASEEAIQQSTPYVVARLRASRIARYMNAHSRGSYVHDVTCSIGTEGAALIGEGLTYIGSDLDHSRLLMARHNIPEALFLQADACTPTTEAPIIVADPARRSQGRRTTHEQPRISALCAAYKDRELAIKCVPGINYSEWPGLVSVVSVQGAVKEATLYTEGLGAGVRREAVIVHKAAENMWVYDTLNDTMPEIRGGALVDSPGAFIIDPDGAIVRAGLVRHYAAREGLWMLDERIAYLTGDHIPAGYSGFPYRAAAPLRNAKNLVRNCSQLEIVVRGVDVDPDALRKKLGVGTKKKASTQRKNSGEALTLVCTRIGRSAVALLCGPRMWSAPECDLTSWSVM